MEVNWKIWAFFLVIAILNCIRVAYLGHLGKGTLQGYLIFGWGILLINIFLEIYSHYSLRVVATEGEKATLKLRLIHKHSLMNLIYQCNFHIFFFLLMKCS